MPRKAAAAEEDEGPDKAWMESYADAMTLLLAFFIMLFAFALVDETKFFDFKVGMVTALGVSDPVNERADSLLESGTGIVQAIGEAAVSTEELRNEIVQKEGDLAESGTITAENVEEVRDLLDAKFAELGAAEFVTVDIDERGVIIRYDGAVLFESGSADLGESSDIVLAASADVLELIDNPIDVEGHTDDVPTGGQWISNWELSAARASAVTRWLLDFGQLPPRRLAAVGLADTRPVADNDSDEGRSRNRRVEIVVRVSGLIESDVDVIDPIDDPIVASDGVDGVPSATEPESDPTNETEES
ncbi:MAG: flagellar motor protein MotB [Acidimicrobiia bacterium]|nr:flagellar motor protein MotB [Acidimicrobiia bacterium]